jgi:hypothetical protein
MDRNIDRDRPFRVGLRASVAGLWLAAVAVGLGVLLPSLARATVLTFDTTSGPLNSTYLWNTPNGSLYGDNVSSPTQNGFAYGDVAVNPTPNVVLTYEQAGNSSSLWLDSGVLTDGTAVSALILTGDPGYTVTLRAFDAVALRGTTTDFSYIKVFLDGSATPAYTLSPYYITGSNTLNEGDEWAAGSLSGNVVRLEWFFGGSFGNAYNHGLDSIDFVQSIPEPASLALIALTSAWAVRRRPRREL